MAFWFTDGCIPKFFGSLCDCEVCCNSIVIQILIPSPGEGDAAGPVLDVDGVGDLAVGVACGVFEGDAYLIEIVALDLHRAEVDLMRYGDALTVAGGVCSLDSEHGLIACGGVVVLAGREATIKWIILNE